MKNKILHTQKEILVMYIVSIDFNGFPWFYELADDIFVVFVGRKLTGSFRLTIQCQMLNCSV